jgi:YD repeat-containing protein
MAVDRRDLLLRLAAIGVCASPEAAAQTSQYRYDAHGRLVRVTYNDGSATHYVYDAAGNRTQVVHSPPGAFTATIAITGPAPVNLRTLADAAGYNGFRDVIITFTLASGVTLTGAAGVPNGGLALDTGAWPLADFTITLALQVSGKIYGGGGRGGAGALPGGASASGTGGDAISCQAPLSITVNAGGEVKAGGGGGGGGGGWFNNITEFDLAGGGGGGGFPNGAGGAAGDSTMGTGAQAGATGTTSGGGANGAGDGLLDGHTGGPGGGGGNAGVQGANANDGGGTTGSGWVRRARTLGSAPGYAIRKNGNAVNVTNNGTITGTQA